VYTYPFQRVGQAIAYYNTRNPARAKNINLLEPDTQYHPIGIDLDDSPRDIWAAVCLAIHATLKQTDPISRDAFKRNALGAGETHLHPSELANILGVTPQIIYRKLRQVRNELEAELINRRLMPPHEDA